MDERDFTSIMSGKIGSSYGKYMYFQPNQLPFDIELKPEFLSKSMEAIILLSRLDGKASEMDESERDMFMKAFSLKESTHSSSIEGTRTTLDDLYRYEKTSPENEVRLRDSQEVLNYKKALGLGLEMMNGGARLDHELLLHLQGILLSGVRGENKSPGKYRTEQNAIGKLGDTLETAKFVPATPESIGYLLDNLFEFIESDENPIIKIALAHYQFETIHPFRDGNGRIGRLMIPLILSKENILHFPMIYPSEYFDRNRDQYIDRLYSVSARDEFNEWIGFFIDALIHQTIESIRAIDELRQYKKELRKLSSNITELSVIEMLFSNPYINSADVMSECDVSNPTANKVLANLESKGIIREITGKRRNMLYAADGILDILTKRH